MEYEDEELDYTVLGNFGLCRDDYGYLNPASKTFLQSMPGENPALTVASLILAVYSSLESKIPDSGQLEFRNKVWKYLEFSFPNSEQYTSIK